MHRPTPASARGTARPVRRTATLAAALMLLAALAGIPAGTPAGTFGPAPVRAASTCTGWTSDSVPPTTIRVLRTVGAAAGTVQVVPFHDYVTVVMAAEWGPSDPTEALKAGAVAVKQYAWYRAMEWRGGTATDGSCYDVVDSPIDQVYWPEAKTPSASEISAVDATWGISVLKSGSLFATHYTAGSSVACGANADGWHLYQLSAMQCAEGGMAAATILQTYYDPGAQVVGAAGSDTLRFMSQPATGTAGAPFVVPPVVTILDPSGAPVTSGPGSTAAVTLAVAASTGDATLNCAAGLTVTAVAGVATWPGCSISMPGAGYVLVATTAGLAPTSSAPFVVTVAPATLSLEVPASIVTWGGAVALTVRLASPVGGGSVAGRPVQVQHSVDGLTWTTAASLVTDATGSVSLAFQPVTNLQVRAVFAGAPDLGAATSPVQRVLVRQLALLRPDNRGLVRPLARGATVTFATLVRPARADLPAGRVLYRVTRLVGRTWILQRAVTVTADATGRATLAVTFPAAGNWSVRAMAVPTQANANSAWSPLERYLVN